MNSGVWEDFKPVVSLLHRVKPGQKVKSYCELPRGLGCFLCPWSLSWGVKEEGAQSIWTCSG